jgi:hypothetical protein
MLPKKVDYKSYVRGDTINARQFTLSQTINSVTTPIDLTNALIDVTFASSQSKHLKSIGNGITITDASNGVFQIDAFVLNYPGVYQYDVNIVFPNGVVRTYINGSIKIENDTTQC